MELKDTTQIREALQDYQRISTKKGDITVITLFDILDKAELLPSLQADNEELKAENAKLKAEVNKLKKKLNKQQEQ